MRKVKIKASIEAHIDSYTKLKIKVLSGEIEVKFFEDMFGKSFIQTMNSMQNEILFDVKGYIKYEIKPISIAEIEYKLI